METHPSPASPAPASAAASPAGSAGPAPGTTGAALRQAHDAVLAKHRPNVGQFKAGQPAWNAGLRKAVGGAGPEPAGQVDLDCAPPGIEPAPAPAPLVDKETVKRLVELGLGALDKSLQVHMAAGWYSISGDMTLATQQAAFYKLKHEQQEAIALCAGLCAEKYGAALQYLPEVGLAVTGGTYLFTWLIGFNKLKQAVLVKEQALAADKKRDEKKETPL